MSALPSAAEATGECSWAAAVGQFSIQQPWLRFLEVHSLSVQTHCVILLCYNTERRAVRFDLDKCAVLSPIPTIQVEIEGQHLFTLH